MSNVDDIDDFVPGTEQSHTDETSTTTTTSTTTKSTTKSTKSTKSTTKSTKPTTKKATPKKSPHEEDPFQGKDYYECFDIAPEATNDEIIKAYKKLALKYHPDRNLGDKLAAKHFATVSKMHQVLIDPRKRKFYDSHGETTDMSDGFLNAYDLWSETFPGITPDDTEAFKTNYQDTEEEYTDVKVAFEKCKGNLYLMMRHELFFSTPDTQQRDKDMVEMLIKRGDITNETYIANFRATADSAGQSLKESLEEEERQYNELQDIAYQRALKKSKNGKVSEAVQMVELQRLIQERNRKSDGADTLENIALSLGSLTKTDVKTTMPLVTGIDNGKKGGRTNAKQSRQKQSNNGKINAKELDSDNEVGQNNNDEENQDDEKHIDSEEDNKDFDEDDETLSKEINTKKRPLKKHK